MEILNFKDSLQQFWPQLSKGWLVLSAEQITFNSIAHWVLVVFYLLDCELLLLDSTNPRPSCSNSGNKLLSTGTFLEIIYKYIGGLIKPLKHGQLLQIYHTLTYMIFNIRYIHTVYLQHKI